MTARAGSADIGRIQTNARIVLRLAYFGLGFKETALTQLQRIQPMPVRLESVFETIMYEYAKLIADRAVEERESLAPAKRTSNDYWSFVALTFKKLKNGRISSSSVLRENKQLVQSSQCCAYCASNKSLQWYLVHFDFLERYVPIVATCSMYSTRSVVHSESTVCFLAEPTTTKFAHP